jgi:rhomboid-related protein 1/2/3
MVKKDLGELDIAELKKDLAESHACEMELERYLAGQSRRSHHPKQHSDRHLEQSHSEHQSQCQYHSERSYRSEPHREENGLRRSSSVELAKTEMHHLLRRRKPIFIVLHSFVVVLLFVIGIAMTDGSGLAHGMISIDSATVFQIHDECEDTRSQYWRMLLYQFTHVGSMHLLGNLVLQVVIGIPLEQFQGTIRMLIIYNVGVVGGALCFAVSDAHGVLVGCSGGVYCLVGMCCGDLSLNWVNHRCRWGKAAALGFFVALNVALANYSYYSKGGSMSHSAHLGGIMVGMCMSVTLGRNIFSEKWKRYYKILAFIVSACLTTFAVTWIATAWPPRSIFEVLEGTAGWCDYPL